MSSWVTSELKYALGLGGLLSFYGIVGAIVLLMPEGSVARDQKVIIIALLILTLPFTLLAGFLITRRSKRKRSQQAETTPAPETAVQKVEAAPTGVYPEINASVEEAINFLKDSNLGDGGKDAIYSLPWYLVAGDPRSGKSSLVISSNLDFQALPSQRRTELRTVSPTKNVDWRVTNDAVFIDTAGRYHTEGSGTDEWSALLEAIRRVRSARPIDGMLLVVNAADVTKNDDRENEALAKVLRARLDDAIIRLKVRFPVYLIFSHADSIEGFRDSFSVSKNEDKALVWGSTLPLEKSENAQALFDGEFETLVRSVTLRRLFRLSAPFSPVRQLRIFNFPLHFSSARRKFGLFVNTLFRPNPFSENPLLRGFYFTASPETKRSEGQAKTTGDGYFTERLFRDVVLRDRDLTRTFIAQRQRPPLFGWFLSISLLGLMLLILAFTAVSLILNRQLLDESVGIGEKAITLRKADSGRNVLTKKEDEVRQEMRVLEDMRPLLARLDTYEREGAPVYMRFGMYTGNGIYERNLLPLYFNLVEGRFKEPTVKRLEAELRKFADGQGVANPSQLTEKEEQYLDRHYNLLKAYLMLSGQYRGKAEASHVANTIREYWVGESKVPADMTSAAEQHLEFWAKQVDRDADNGNFPRIDLNAKLVDDTRRKLQAFPAVYRYYSNRVTEISRQVDDEIGATTVEAILTRNGADTSYVGGNYRVPGAFTRAGLELMKKAIAEADQKLAEDDWVMGELGKNSIARSSDAAKLEDRYYRDYADHWRAFVKAVQVRPYKNKNDAGAAFQSFSSANSPIKILSREIATNTNLSAKLPSKGWIDWFFSLFSRGSTVEGGATQPEKEFRPLFSFIGTPEQAENAPVEKYQALMGRVFNDISGVSEDRMKRIAEQMANDEDPIKIIEREKAVTNLISGFNETPAGQELSAFLQRPIGNLKALLGADAKSQIARTWTDEILPAAREIEKGYPFEDSQTEADMTKLTAFLNPSDGKFSKFYDEKLSRYFEESGGSLKVKATSEIQFTEEFVLYLNRLVNIRKTLFGNSPTPKFEYEFTLNPAAGTLVEVTIDGQKVTSEGTRSIKGTFPATGSAETGVLLRVVSAGSEPSPAASPASGVAATSSAGGPLTYPGTWGLFRFVDSARPVKQPGGEYLLSISVSGKQVGATIRPSGGDPFDRAVFKQTKAPQGFMK